MRHHGGVTTPLFGVDYSGTPPTPAELLAARVAFVGRYGCPLPNTKALTLIEAQRLTAAGIRIVSIWESTAARASEGAIPGARDALAAVAFFASMGQPAGTPIYFAVDEDVDAGAVLPYFQDAALNIWPYVMGGYGSRRVVDGLLAAGAIVFVMQTVAWSGGLLSPRAHIYQAGQTTIGGTQCDIDQALVADYGGWLIGQPDDEQELFPMAIFKDDNDALAYFVRKTYLDVLDRKVESVDVQNRWGQYITANGADLFLAAIVDSGEGTADVNAHLAELASWEAKQPAVAASS